MAQANLQQKHGRGNCRTIGAMVGQEVNMVVEVCRVPCYVFGLNVRDMVVEMPLSSIAERGFATAQKLGWTSFGCKKRRIAAAFCTALNV